MPSFISKFSCGVRDCFFIFFMTSAASCGLLERVDMVLEAEDRDGKREDKILTTHSSFLSRKCLSIDFFFSPCLFLFPSSYLWRDPLPVSYSPSGQTEPNQQKEMLRRRDFQYNCKNESYRQS